MFEDSLLESGGKLRTHRSLTTTISLLFQLMIIGALMLLPLLSKEALPKKELLTFLVAPPPPPPPPATESKVKREVRRPAKSEITPSGDLLLPTRIPKNIQMIREEVPPPLAPPTAGVPGGIAGGQVGGVLGGIISSIPIAHVTRPTLTVPKRVRVSQGVTTGMLIHKVIPRYPSLARTARIQGQVVLNAVISKSGTIERLQLASGPPMLAPAAIEAVKDWRYRPYLLNGHPVEVETKVTVNFSLG